MGAVNYSRSDYITLGVKPYDPELFTDENGNIDYEEMGTCYEADQENADSIIKSTVFTISTLPQSPDIMKVFPLISSLIFRRFLTIAKSGGKPKRK